MSSSGWTQTKIVLEGFFDLLACGKCKKTPKTPMRYVTCGHFFCDNCITGETTCFQCKIPVGPSEIQPYGTVAKLIEYCHIIKDVISEIKPEDLKPLAKAVHQFAAERTGVVPETDSESEDEIVESTPPDRRSGEKKNSQFETCGSLDPNESSRYRGNNDSELESAGYVDPTQFSQNRVQKKLTLESVGFVNPAQLSENRVQKKLAPESVGFVNSTQLSQIGSKKDSEPETVGYVDSTQLTQHRGIKASQPETARYVDPTQLTQHRGKKVSQPETAGYVDPTQLTQHRGKKVSEPETVGYVDPTQLTQHRGKKVSEPETVGYVDPTQLTQHRGKKVSEPETVGYVDPTQLTQNHEKKVLQPETAGYVDPTQFFNPCRTEENLYPQNAEYVDPILIDKSHDEQDLEPETPGYLDRTQTPPSKKKKRFPLKIQNKQKNKNSMPESFASFVKPTQTCQSVGKFDFQPKTFEYVDSNKTSMLRLDKKDSKTDSAEFIDTASFVKRDGLNLKPETAAGYVESTEKSRIPDGKVSMTESSEIIVSTLFEKSARTVPETVGYVDLTQKCRILGEKVQVTENAEFIDPKSFEKLDIMNLQPETAGYRDATQVVRHSEKNIATESSEFVASGSIDRRFEKIDQRPKNVPIDWYEAMDSTEQIADNDINSSIRQDLSLASESVEMNRANFTNIVVPEIPENVKDTSNYGETPMEIEEESFTTTLTHARMTMEKVTNIVRETSSTISSLHDNTIRNVEIREETPFEQLKRIKSMALNRRSKNRKKFHDRDESMEYVDIRKKSPEKKAKIVENLSQDRCNEKDLSLNRDPVSVASGEVFCTETEEFVEKTPPKQLRRVKKSLEKKYSTSDNDNSPRSDDTRDKVVNNFETKESAESKEITKDYESEEKNVTIERERRSGGIDESEKTPDTRVKETLKQLRSVENLNIESTIETTAKKSKEKLVKLKNRRSIDKPRATVPKAIPKNLNKRNAKGETPLHTACVKGQIDYVKALLEAGSNPNTKDNANWTPLQEAVTFGHLEICKMLLQAGASANTPAMDNRTALHDAAGNDKLDEAALLLRFSANKNVYDKFGKRPIDYAVSDEMRDLLTDESKIDEIIDDVSLLDSTLDQSIIVPNAKIVVLPSNLSNKNRKLLSQLASKLKVEVATSFRPTVTHLVVETNERNMTKLTYYVMLAILQGKWILNSQWLTICTDLNDISEIDLELFEVHGAPNPETPMRARMNEEKQNPRLFNNCFFYFAIGPRCTWSYEKFEFTKESLTTLVHGGQGEILNREPDPEDVKDYKLTPFHVAHKPIHPLHRCSHYIIYMPGKDEPRVKYNMPHIKSLPVGWFLECIEKFSLVDPLLMGIL